MASELYYLVKDVGFPIAMCLYFIAIGNTTIKKNTEALIELKTEIRSLKRR